MKRKSVLCRTVLVFSLIFCLLIQIGCGLTNNQRKNTANFSKATVVLSKATSNELIEMRNGVIQMNTYGLAAVGEESPLPKINNMEQAFKAIDIKARIQAVEVLKTYGELLLSLVENTQEKELRNASEDFAASINGLPKNYKIEGLNTEAVQEVVYQIGRFIVESKKAKAVRQIVNTYKGSIDKLCNLLSKDFDVKENRLLTEFQSSGNIAIVKIQNAFLDPNINVITRQELVEMYKKTQAHLDRVPAISKSISKAVSDMKKANEKLSSSLKDDSNDDINRETIREYGNSVKEVIDFIKVLGKTVASDK